MAETHIMNSYMRHIIQSGALVTFILLIGGCAQEAQKDEGPEQPKPASVEVLLVDSQKHLLKPISGNIVSLNFFIRGGVGNYNVSNSGIEALALKSLIKGGPKSMTQEEWDTRKTSANIVFNTKTVPDYSVLSVKAPVKEWEQAWDLVKELIQRPEIKKKAFRESKKALLKKSQKRNIQPANFLANKVMGYAFREGDYAKAAKGTAQTLENIDQKQALRYYKGMMTANRTMTVTAGPLDSAKLAGHLNKLWMRLPERSYRWARDSTLVISESTIEFFDKAVSTNYLRGFFSVPPAGTQENIAMKLGLNLLEAKIQRSGKSVPWHEELTLTMLPLKSPAGVLATSSEHPNEVAKGIIKNIKQVKNQGFDSFALAHEKNQVMTEYYLNRQTAQQQAYAIGHANMMDHWSNAELMDKRLKNLEVELVNQVFKEYIQGIQWYYMGDRSKVDKETFLAPL